MIHPIASAPIGVLPNIAIWCSAITRPLHRRLGRLLHRHGVDRLEARRCEAERDAQDHEHRVARRCGEHHENGTEGRQCVGERPAGVRRDPRCIDAAEDRADRADAHGRPHGAGTTVEAELHHRGERRLEVECHQSDDRHHEERPADVRATSHVLDGGPEVATRARPDRPGHEPGPVDARRGPRTPRRTRRRWRRSTTRHRTQPPSRRRAPARPVGTPTRSCCWRPPHSAARPARRAGTAGPASPGARRRARDPTGTSVRRSTHRLGSPAETTRPKASASAPDTADVTSSRRRLSTRSASTPAGAPRRSSGRNCRATATPSRSLRR